MGPEQLADSVAGTLGRQVDTQVSHGLLTVDVPAGAWLDALTRLRDELDCTFFDWLTGVDEQEEGIRVVVHLHSPTRHHHLLVRTLLGPDEPRLPSAVSVYRGANWHERETAEMFGVDFTGHPGLDPLLLPEEFRGHPLRKDFVLASRVAKAWPGMVDPGQSVSQAHQAQRRRKPKRALGVPDPNEWGPHANGAGEAAPGGDKARESEPEEEASP
jgi:NADH-quinone oxidoreductase subunit C